MKLNLWAKQYQFAVEQTIMALFPSESIETYVPQESQAQGENTMEVSLSQGKASCNWCWKGELYQETVDSTPETQVFALKTAIFKVMTQALEISPPWGSLSGVRPAKLATKLLVQGKNVAETLEKDYHVDPIRAKLAEDCGKISHSVQNQGNPPLSIYVGIPFCPSRCHYCSFFSEIPNKKAEKTQLDSYLQALFQEIKAVSAPKISSLYVGGGTPTVLTAVQLNQLLTLARESFPEIGEFTVEAGRPETLNLEKIHVMEQHGVERISINPQSLNQETLDKIGRNHSVEQVYEAFFLAKGKFIVNMDLIAGLSTPEDFTQTLAGVLALSPEQITVHSLTVKKNTPLHQEKNQDSPANAWKNSLNQAWDSLMKAGYAPYYLYRQKNIIQGLENVGWYRKDSQICRYNLEMMEEFQSILGLGAGSMTKIITADDIIRQKNHKHSKEYEKNIVNLMEKKKELLQLV